MTLETVPRYNSEQTDIIDEHAIVIGGSMAGLVTARVLADYYEEVTLLERDTLSDTLEVRRGVPQGDHVHVLLEGGRSTIADLLPGFCDDLISSGGVLIDESTNLHRYQIGDYLANGDRRLPSYTASRPLFENTVRNHVADTDGVTIRDGCHVVEYLSSDDGESVDGVAYEDEGRIELRSDLVVDATGRRSHTPDWLERHGYTRPPVEKVHQDLAYCSVTIERPPDDRRAFLYAPSPGMPNGHRTATAVPIEDNQWVVTLIGMFEDHPPTTRDGFVEFADSLPGPDIADLLREQSWTTDEITKYPFPFSQRRRYEHLDEFPEDLLVIGNAITSFNPIYGQGMSVAALEALQLHHTLADGGQENLAPRFFDSIGEIIDIPWFLAVCSDFTFPQTEGDKPQRVPVPWFLASIKSFLDTTSDGAETHDLDVINWYLGELIQTAHTDPIVSDAFSRVARLEKPNEALFAPEIAQRVLQPSPTE